MEIAGKSGYKSMNGIKGRSMLFSWTWNENKKKMRETFANEYSKLRGVGLTQRCFKDGIDMIKVEPKLTKKK